MTDNEIMKALEMCIPIEHNCSLCPLSEEIYCCNHLLHEVFDLYNRQKAEIEKKDTEIDILIRKNETLKDENFELRAEVERKTTECERLEIYMDELVKQKLNKAKAEAIKEFAERLKQCGRYPQCRPFPDNPVLNQNRIWLEEDIDSLVNYESSKMTE